jgi:hypothetical protein
LPTSFNAESPWDQVWDEATNRTVWWHDQFERPAGLIANHVRSLSSVLDGDVQIANNRAPANSPPQQQQQQQQSTKGGGKVQKPKNKRKENYKKKGGKDGQKGSGKVKSCSACWSESCPGIANLRDCPKYDPDYNKKKGKGKGKNTKGKGSW